MSLPANLHDRPAPTGGQLARLPKWAREHIEEQRREIARQAEELAVRQAVIRAPWLWTRGYGHHDPVPLLGGVYQNVAVGPDDTAQHFQIEHDPRESDRLRVRLPWCYNAMAVLPIASNVVEIRGLDR